MKNGCPIQAVAVAVLFGCFRASADNGHLLRDDPGASFAFMAESRVAAIYGLCAIALVLIVITAVRWTRRWRRRVLRQRDDEVFQLIDEWTKGLQQEVAAQKQAQRALKEGHELALRQERLAAVGQLTSGLTHEFNNIMTIVQGHASLLMDDPKLDEESAKSLAHITNGVEQMAKLIRQMLAFSRQQVMQLKPLDLKEALGLASDMLQRLLGEEIVLRFEIVPHLPSILADAEMFQQIMVNLAANARDAMSSGGQLTIRAAEASFTATDIPPKSERRTGRFVRLSITDTGSGMDGAVIHRLFEPFFTTKEAGIGSGLGLATVFGMVNQQQGWIEVESQVGQGATFDIYFPVTDQALPRPAQTASLPEVRGGKETVLVVEDESVLRELVREILTARGYCILEATDGVEALTMWDEHRDQVDLLLTDMTMPHGISGRDLAEKLRKDEPQLPVIFSSGYSQEMIARSDDTVENATYLSKPYLPSELVRAVRQTLDAIQKRESSMAAPSS
jgi:signal transduction histidine kinase/ActR/RegA family two-component response regulator